MGRFSTVFASMLLAQAPHPAPPRPALPLPTPAVQPVAATISPITITGVPTTPAARLPFRGVVAAFTTTNPGADVSDYSATIDWGDGTSSDGELIPGPDGGFRVTGEHIYARPGNYTVKTTVAPEADATASVSIQSEAVVGEPTLVVTPLTPEAIAGIPFAGSLVSIEDSNPTSKDTDLTSNVIFPTILGIRVMYWGDGSQVPASGNNMVVVGTDDRGQLHIRVFDAAGKRIKDVTESDISEQASNITALKQQLPRLLPPHTLTNTEKLDVTLLVTSLVGPVLPGGASNPTRLIVRSGGGNASTGVTRLTIDTQQTFSDAGTVPVRVIVARADHLEQKRTVTANVRVHENRVNRWVVLRPNATIENPDSPTPIQAPGLPTVFHVLGNGLLPGSSGEPGKLWYWVASPDGLTGYVEPDALLDDESARDGLLAAISALSPAINSESCDAGSFRQRGLFHLALGDTEAAIVDFTDALRIDPHDAISYHGRGSANLQAQRLLRAYGDFSEALRWQPDRLATWIGRGLVNRDSSNPAQQARAERDFTMALRADPRNLAARSARDTVNLTSASAAAASPNTESVADGASRDFDPFDMLVAAPMNTLAKAELLNGAFDLVARSAARGLLGADPRVTQPAPTKPEGLDAVLRQLAIEHAQAQIQDVRARIERSRAEEAEARARHEKALFDIYQFQRARDPRVPTTPTKPTTPPTGDAPPKDPANATTVTETTDSKTTKKTVTVPPPAK